MGGFLGFSQPDDQINQNGEVDNDGNGFGHAGMTRHFVTFDWQKGTGHDDRQIFGPGFGEEQADAFRDKEGAIDKSGRAEERQPGREPKKFFEESMQKLVMRVEIQQLRPVFESGFQVFMKQGGHSNAGGDEERALEEL